MQLSGNQVGGQAIFVAAAWKKKTQNNNIWFSWKASWNIIESFFLFLAQNAKIVLQNISTRSWNTTGFCPYEEWGCMPIYHPTQLLIMALWQNCFVMLSVFFFVFVFNQNIIWHNCWLWRSCSYCYKLCVCLCLCLFLCLCICLCLDSALAKLL